MQRLTRGRLKGRLMVVVPMARGRRLKAFCAANRGRFRQGYAGGGLIASCVLPKRWRKRRK